MQRNWDLLRDLLLIIEEVKDYESRVHPNSLPSYGSDEVAYHIGLLIEAGYANGTKCSDHDLIRQSIASSLTWEGHELLDKIRSETIWSKTKSTALEKGVDLTFEVVKSIASKLIERILSGA